MSYPYFMLSAPDDRELRTCKTTGRLFITTSTDRKYGFPPPTVSPEQRLTNNLKRKLLNALSTQTTSKK